MAPPESTTEMNGQAHVVEDATAEWLRAQGAVRGVEMHDDKDVLWILSGGSVWGNAAVKLRLAPETVSHRLHELIARYRHHHRGSAFWISPFATPSDLEERLGHLGFRCRKRFPAMYCNLSAIRNVPALPEGLEITLIEDYAPFENRELIHPGIGPLTTDIRKFSIERISTLAAIRPRTTYEFLATWHGQPSGVTTLFAGSKVAGIHDVAVLERARNHGIGTALVRHACMHARELGYEGATLIASGMGEGVYRRAGFTQVCRMAYWYSALKSS